jgi:hypothetical protein
MKKINLKLVGLDGNAFFIMGAFSKQAKREGWSKAEIDAVLNEAKSGDYNHLLATITDHCINPAGTDGDEECIDNDFTPDWHRSEYADDDEEDDAGLRTWRTYKGEHADV